MTKIIIYKNKNHILGFEVSGHSGYAEEGSDIVCSAISTATQMAVLGITKILKLDAFVEVSNGYLKFMLNKNNYLDDKVQFILKSMQSSLQEIAKEYGKHFNMEAKKRDVF